MSWFNRRKHKGFVKRLQKVNKQAGTAQGRGAPGLRMGMCSCSPCWRRGWGSEEAGAAGGGETTGAPMESGFHHVSGWEQHVSTWREDDSGCSRQVLWRGVPGHTERKMGVRDGGRVTVLRGGKKNQPKLRNKGKGRLCAFSASQWDNISWARLGVASFSRAVLSTRGVRWAMHVILAEATFFKKRKKK